MRGGNGSQWKVTADWLWGESNKGLWKARNKRKVFSSRQATGSKGSVNSSIKSCAAWSWFLLPCSCKLSLLKILIHIFNNLDKGQGRQVKWSSAIHSSSVLIAAAEIAFSLTCTRPYSSGKQTYSQMILQLGRVSEQELPTYGSVLVLGNIQNSEGLGVQSFKLKVPTSF